MPARATACRDFAMLRKASIWRFSRAAHLFGYFCGNGDNSKEIHASPRIGFPTRRSLCETPRNLYPLAFAKFLLCRKLLASPAGVIP